MNPLYTRFAGYEAHPTTIPNPHNIKRRWGAGGVVGWSLENFEVVFFLEAEHLRNFFGGAILQEGYPLGRPVSYLEKTGL